MIEIKTQISENDWKQYLDECNDATIYHTPEWKTFLEKTFDYKPHYLFATDESGQMKGMLPLFQVKSRLTGNRLCSVPFSHECGCLGDGNTCTALVDEAVAVKNRLHIDKIEIRNDVDNPVFQGNSAFCTHILELSQDPEETWKKLNKSSVRWAVTKAKKLGVSVVSSTNIEDLKEFYELNCITKQSLGVPCHPWDFFKNLFSVLDGYVNLYLSQYEGNIIAGGIMECYKGQVLYGYGAADPAHLNVHPYNAFIWKSIEDACLNGSQTYDFGRTSYESTGLIQFKKKWGTREIKLCYSTYPNATDKDKSAVTDRNSSVYRIGNKVIRAMPMPVYKTFSNTVFWNFG